MGVGTPDTDRAIGLAKKRLTRTKSGIRRVLVGGVMLFLVGVVWLGLETASAIRLQDHGRHALARIDQVYEGRASGITVSYAASNVYVSIPLWLGTGSYKVGGRVRISYDPKDPSHAVIASGFPTPGGWNGLPLFLLIGGPLLVIITVIGLVKAGKPDAILARPPTPMAVTSYPIETSDDVELTLEQNGTPVASLGRDARKRWQPVNAPRPVLVFGEPIPKSTVLVVDGATDTTLYRRLSNPKPHPVEADAVL